MWSIHIQIIPWTFPFNSMEGKMRRVCSEWGEHTFSKGSDDWDAVDVDPRLNVFSAQGMTRQGISLGFLVRP